jgi:hypothetical protein
VTPIGGVPLNFMLGKHAVAAFSLGILGRGIPSQLGVLAAYKVRQ